MMSEGLPPPFARGLSLSGMEASSTAEALTPSLGDQGGGGGGGGGDGGGAGGKEGEGGGGAVTPVGDLGSSTTKRSSSLGHVRADSISTLRTQHTRRWSQGSLASDYYSNMPDSRESSRTSGGTAAQQKELEATETAVLGELESIQVLVRVRPLLGSELAMGAEHDVVECSADGSNYVSVRAGARRSIRCKYDHVFGPRARQTDVYKQVEDCAARVLEGYNATIMAYGQTGSGKTHSMFGPQGYTQELMKKGRVPDVAGIIPRAISDIFVSIRRRQIEDYTVYCSFVQIYNEQLYDMLRDGSRDNPLVIHEDSNHEIYVQGLSEFMVKSGDECMALLRIGEENRAIRETHMNQASSRSHSLFTLVVEQKRRDEVTGEVKNLRSKLNLVDLAGSEKWDTRQDIADQHALELANINYSLFTLGRCIAALTAKGGNTAHVPFRDSKLTRLIQDSLGGNTRTRIIATLSPTADCVEETVSTLKFADRAKQVLVYVRQSEKPAVDFILIEKLQREVGQLRGLVLKLKESQCAGPAALIALHKNGKKLTVKELVQKIEALEEELKRERYEHEKLQSEHESLKEVLASAKSGSGGGGNTQTVGSGETDQSGEGIEAGLQGGAATGGHGTIEGGEAGKEGGAGVTPPAEVTVPVEQYNTVTQRLHESESVHKFMTTLLARFFAFEIEEAELRKKLEPYVPNIDSIIATPRPQKKKLVPIGDRQRQQHHHHPRHHLHHHHEPHDDDDGGDQEEYGEEGDEEEDEEAAARADPLQLVLPKLNAEGVPTVSFRIRGKKQPGGAAMEGVVPFRSLHYVKEDEEEKLIQQLKEARRRMRKHMKLQEWLLTKEQKELEAAEREEEERRNQERVVKEKDAKFRERAQKQKKKLERYYATLKERAAQDLYGGESPIHRDSETGTTHMHGDDLHHRHSHGSPPRGLGQQPQPPHSAGDPDEMVIQPPPTLAQELDVRRSI